MSTESQTPQRRPGPHAPLPNTGAAPADLLLGVASPEGALSSSTAPVAGEEDPRARAARRTLELREHGSLDEGTDKFYIDPRVIPDGWSYEWKMLEVLGRQDPSYQVNLARKGWEAVPRARHPEMMPDNYPGNTILRDGMILMERPKEITDEAKAKEYRAARDQVRAKETQLGVAPAGQFERANKDQPMATIKKSYESIPIPEK